MHPLRLAPLLPAHIMAPLALSLDRRRKARVEPLLAANGSMVDVVRQALTRCKQGPDPHSERLIKQYSHILLEELRNSEPGGVDHFAIALDQAVRSRRPEIMDWSGVPLKYKQLEMKWLDQFNVRMGSYASFAAHVRTAVAGLKQARIYDLAAGSGGLMRYMAAHPAPGTALDLTASDLHPAYVATGQELATAAQLPVRFECRDALQLHDLKGHVELFVCTQSGHHLDSGALVAMIAQAIDVAPRGLVFIDLLRSLGNVAAAALATGLSCAVPTMQWDGMQSVRRSYTPAELQLLARLAGAQQVDVQVQRPAFVVLRASR